VCSEEAALQEVIPDGAREHLLPDSQRPDRPFSLKHALQQASIVGNMQRYRLLEDAEGCAFIEFGAGASREMRALFMVAIRVRISYSGGHGGMRLHRVWSRCLARNEDPIHF
jgi:hypothetical protein